MRIIFSRKGFDSAAGGGPSPIVDGRPVTLPIPAGTASQTSYADLGLGEHAERASRGKVSADDLCHHDPMFLPQGRALLGQCGAAQTHLSRGGVQVGDLFVFFGLFRAGREAPHHRIFGYLRVEECLQLTDAEPARIGKLRQLGFPHALAMHAANDVAYYGTGRVANRASDALRLTIPEGPPSLWQIPAWLRETGLTYHGRGDRWLPDNRLQSVARGQEFIANVGARHDARDWAEAIIAEIES